MNSAKTFRRLAALLLTLAMMLGSVATAYADTQAYTNKKTAIYVEDSGKLKKAGTAAKGTEVTVKDTNGGWAQVEKDGNTAYVKLSALTVKAESGSKDGDTVKCNKTIYAAVEGVKVYESDDVESEEITTLSLGAKQNMVAYNDEWCMVKNGKYYGYVLREQMSLEKVNVATAEPTEEAKEETEKITKCNKTVYVANDGAKVYTDDDTSSTVQDTL